LAIFAVCYTCFLFGRKDFRSNYDVYGQANADVNAQRAALQKQLNDIEAQITQYNKT